MRKINVGDELFIVEIKKGEQFPCTVSKVGREKVGRENDRIEQLKEKIAELREEIAELREEIAYLRDELSDVISEKEELEDREYAIRQEIEAKTSAIEAAISQAKEQAQEAARHRMTATCDHCHAFSFEARQTDAGIVCPACAEVTAAQIPAFLR